jgi:nucleoside-diphosphate-sugar epimerase
MCASYQAEYGVNFNIVRLGHIYGPSASRSDKRVSSDFAFKAATGENLVLKSEGKQIRSYCYSLDCASAVLSVLTSGETGEAYNISNKNSIINIRQMAECLATAGNVELIFDLPTQSEASAFNPMDNSSLDSSKLESLGWHGIFDAKTGLAHTVRILKGEFARCQVL